MDLVASDSDGRRGGRKEGLQRPLLGMLTLLKTCTGTVTARHVFGSRKCYIPFRPDTVQHPKKKFHLLYQDFPGPTWHQTPEFREWQKLFFKKSSLILLLVSGSTTDVSSRVRAIYVNRVHVVPMAATIVQYGHLSEVSEVWTSCGHRGW